MASHDGSDRRRGPHTRGSRRNDPRSVLGLPDEIKAHLELLGDPELVVVDARTLRLLAGDLADLIILQEADAFCEMKQPRPVFREGLLRERFVWDDDSPVDQPCP